MGRSTLTQTFADRGINSTTLLVPSELVPLFDGSNFQRPVNAAFKSREIIPFEVSLLPPKLRRNQTHSSAADSLIDLGRLRKEAERRNELIKNTNTLVSSFGEPGTPLNTIATEAQVGNLSGTAGIVAQRFNNDLLVSSANSLTQKILNLENLPPLTFIINPSSFTPSYAKKIDEQFARGGWVTEHWGEEQDTITISGSIGGYFTDGYGLTRFHRRDSASYKDLMYLFLIYRNNGYIYEDTDRRRISLVGSVRIAYDSREYIGSFDEMTITESTEKPFAMTYEMSFTVRQRFEIGGG